MIPTLPLIFKFLAAKSIFQYLRYCFIVILEYVQHAKLLKTFVYILYNSFNLPLTFFSIVHIVHLFYLVEQYFFIIT